MECFICEEWDSENEECKQGHYSFSCKKYLDEGFSEIKDVLRKDIKLIDYHNLYKLMYDDIVTGYLVFDFDNFIHEILKAVKNKEKTESLAKFCEKTFHEIVSRFNEHEDYLNNLFDQSTGNLQNEGLPINRYFLDYNYSCFKETFEILKTTPKEKPFITETEDGLQWTYSKKSLSEYFGYMPKRGRKKHKWQVIEKVFNETDLKNSFSTNGNGPKKYSKDYELLLEVLKNTPYCK